MIIRIKKNTGKGVLEYEYIKNDDIVDFGRILSKRQINDLLDGEATILNVDILNHFSDTQIRKEIQSLTGVPENRIDLIYKNIVHTKDGFGKIDSTTVEEATILVKVRKKRAKSENNI